MAKKPPVTSITSGYASNTQLNANFEALRDHFENTLSRDGSTPNAMTADLDLNSNDIINAATIETDTLTVGGSTFDIAALSGLVSVSSQFLDPKNVDPLVNPPTTRDDGSALQAGDIYFNTSNLISYIYTGVEWIALVNTAGEPTVDIFSANGIDSSFTLSTTPISKNYIAIYISAAYINKELFTLVGDTITFNFVPNSGTNNIEVITYSHQLLASTSTFNNITVTGGTIGGTTAITAPHVTSTVTSGESLKLSATTAGTPINTLGFYDTGGLKGEIGYTDADNDELKLINKRPDFLRLGTFGTPRLSIAPSGNVGIKQASPVYDLDVTGDINFTGTLRQNGTAFGGATGSVIEELHSLCNTTSLKNRATIQEITSAEIQVIDSTTSADVNGSLISNYTCPAGTSEIVYEFNFQLASATANAGWSHWRLYYKEGSGSWLEVDKAKTSQQTGSYAAFKYPLRWVFKVNAGTDDSTVGQIAAATPTLSFKWQARSYDATHGVRVHSTYRWDGSAGSPSGYVFSLPSVCIKAIA